MAAYMARHISRLTSYKGTPQVGEDLVQLVVNKQDSAGYDDNFTCKHFLKIQIVPEKDCSVKINDHSTITITPTYGLTLDYTDLVIHSFVFESDGGEVYAVIGY